MRSEYKKLTRNTIIFSIGTFAQKAFAFVFTPFYTSVLTTKDYGVADFLATFCSMLWPVLTLLINEAVLRFCFDKKVEQKQVVSIGIYVNLFGILLLILFSPLLLLSNTLKDYALLFVLYYTTYSINSFFSYALRGIGKEKMFAISGLINTVFTIIFNIIFLLVFKLGVKGYLLSFIMAFLLTSIIQSISTNILKYIVRIDKIDLSLLKKMMKYSFPLIPNSVSWWINNSADKLFIISMCGAAANGLVSVAYKIPSIINVFSSIFNNAFQISAFEQDDDEKKQQFFSGLYGLYSAFCISLGFGLIIFLKVLCKILFAKDFYQAYIYCPLLIYAVIFQILASFYGTIYTSCKKTKMVFVSSVVAAVANIILNWLLIKSIGAIGAVAATCISSAIMWIVRVVDTRKFMPINVNWLKEFCGNFLFTIAVVISTFNINYYWVYSILLFFIFILINKDIMISLVNIVLGKVLKKAGNS